MHFNFVCKQTFVVLSLFVVRICPYILLPLISTLTNMEGFKYGWLDVWNMKINAFMDAVTQVTHIKNADLLLSSGYSGFGIDLKKVNKKLINYFYRSDES